MVQLKTQLEWKWGQTNILPLIGATKISEEGIIEVPSDEIADQLEAMDIGFERSQIKTPAEDKDSDFIPPNTEENELKKTEEDDLGKKQDDGPLSEQTEGGETESVIELSEEVKELHALIDNSTLAQLKEQAKPFPSAEWRLLNKEQLQAYLKSKIQ